MTRRSEIFLLSNVLRSINGKLNAEFGAVPEMGNWKFVASLSKKHRKMPYKAIILCFSFLFFGCREQDVVQDESVARRIGV